MADVDLDKVAMQLWSGSASNGTNGAMESPVATVSSQDVQENLSDVTTQLEKLQTSLASQIDAITANTTAVSESRSTQSSGSGSTAGEIASGVWKYFSSGLGVSSLVTGLLGLFGGDDSEPASLSTYAEPASIDIEGALSGTSGGILGVSYGQDGLPRIAQSSGGSQTSITVQVQALDSQSFLDHSDDIAKAVRKAVLNTNALSDVLNEW